MYAIFNDTLKKFREIDILFTDIELEEIFFGIVVGYLFTKFSRNIFQLYILFTWIFQIGDNLGSSNSFHDIFGAFFDAVSNILGFDVQNSYDNLPKTPDQVNLAMDNNELGIVQLMAPPLMKSPNALNRGGETPIIWAAKEGSNKDIVKILAPLMVNPNAPNGWGWTPIDEAADQGNLDIIEVLAPLTENPNALNQDGWTPIDEAASRGNLDIIEVLAPLTENPNAPNRDGRTPIDLATRHGHQDVVDELNRYVHANE